MEQIQNSQKANVRKLKVCPKAVQRNSYYYASFPEIRICGKWLQDLGFESGRTVSIVQEPNKLTITLDELPEPVTQSYKPKKESKSELHWRAIVMAKLAAEEGGNYGLQK